MHHGKIQASTGENPRSDYETVAVATSREEIERMRPLWTRLAPRDIDSDIDYFSTVVENAGQVINPTIIQLRTPDGRDLMAISRLETLRIPFRLGYAKLGKANVRTIVVTFDGIVGAEGPADEAALMRKLYGFLKSGEADFIVMRNVEAKGTLLREALAVAGAGLRTMATPPSVRWVADIPSSFETFLARRSSRSRSTIRRKARNLEQEFASVRVHRFCRPSEFVAMCDDMDAVAATSYQRGLGIGFARSPIQMALIKHGLEMGRYIVWMLYLDDRPVAFWNGFAYRDTFFIGTPAYDQELAKHSVGAYAMMHMVEDLCADPTISRLDFGQGEADYKSAFGRAERDETDIYLAAPRPFPLLVLSALRLNILLQRRARQAAERFELVHRLKARWRKGALAGT